MGGSIEVRDLCKQYRVSRRAPGLGAALRSVFRREWETVHAVRDLSFEIRAGERVGFLGPNGAGKTTTLKILAGLLHPTAGSVRVAGHVPQLREASFLERITLVTGQKQQLLWDLPPADTFDLNRAIYGVPRERFARTLAELDALLGLGPLSGKPTRQLSLGERMRCELAAALLHEPDVLFLDEPTIGLDVSMQLAVREFLRAHAEKTGATMLLTSHDMDDVLALCPRVVVIDRGTLLYDGDVEGLVRTTRPEKRVAIRCAAPPDRAELEKIGAVIAMDGASAVVRVPHASLREAVSHVLAIAEVVDLTVQDPPLEEVLRDLFARGAAERGA